MKFFVPDQSPERPEDTYNDFQVMHKAADKRIRSITFLDREQERTCNSAVARKSLGTAVRSC